MPNIGAWDDSRARLSPMRQEISLCSGEPFITCPADIISGGVGIFTDAPRFMFGLTVAVAFNGFDGDEDFAVCRFRIFADGIFDSPIFHSLSSVYHARHWRMGMERRTAPNR